MCNTSLLLLHQMQMRSSKRYPKQFYWLNLFRTSHLAADNPAFDFSHKNVLFLLTSLSENLSFSNCLNVLGMFMLLTWVNLLRFVQTFQIQLFHYTYSASLFNHILFQYEQLLCWASGIGPGAGKCCFRGWAALTHDALSSSFPFYISTKFSVLLQKLLHFLFRL